MLCYNGALSLNVFLCSPDRDAHQAPPGDLQQPDRAGQRSGHCGDDRLAPQRQRLRGGRQDRHLPTRGVPQRAQGPAREGGRGVQQDTPPHQAGPLQGKRLSGGFVK